MQKMTVMPPPTQVPISCLVFALRTDGSLLELPTSKKEMSVTMQMEREATARCVETQNRISQE
jgi:hypothetical protein